MWRVDAAVGAGVTGAGRPWCRACSGPGYPLARGIHGRGLSLADRALAAAEEALARTAALNAARRARDEPGPGLDVVLHDGDVAFGNVGPVRRLDFTVIGRAVNEASRMDGPCERLGRSLLLSAPFAARCGPRTVSLNRFTLRGVDGEPETMAPASS